LALFALAGKRVCSFCQFFFGKKTVVQRSPAKRDPDFSLGKRPNKKTDSG